MFNFLSSLPSPSKSKPITRNTYITGKEFLNSSDHKKYYSFKSKDMTIEDLLDTRSDFCSLNRLYIQGIRIPKNYDVVNNNSRFFVESYEALADCTDVSGIVIPFNEMR